MNGWKGPGCRRDPEPPTSADSTQKTHPLAGRTLDNCSGAPVVPGLVMGEKHWTKRSKESGQFMDQKEKGKFKGVRREK